MDVIVKDCDDDGSSSRTDTPHTNPPSRSGRAGRTLPKCARCRNHKMDSPLKNHKRYCRFSNCKCVKCLFTVDRQRVMAKQTAFKRALAQDEDKKLAPGEVYPKEFFSVSQKTNYDSGCGDSLTSSHGSSSGIHSSVESVAIIPPPTKVPSVRPYIDPYLAEPTNVSAEMVLQYSMKLLEMFGFSYDVVTLMYLVVKDSGGDMQQTVRRIAQANIEIRMTSVLREMAMAGRVICCPLYAGTDAPTYDGYAPYIGTSHPREAIDLTIPPPVQYPHLLGQGLAPSSDSTHPLNVHSPPTRVPSSSESPSDYSAA